MKVIEEGNFTGIAICILLLAGAVLVYVSIEWIGNHYLRVLGFSTGLAMIAAAGYSGRAKAIRLKPFDNTYQKAKDSYKEDDVKNNP